MTNFTLKDQQARRAIVEELDTCILVEAGAGSGKTRSLVDRMVALVKEGKCGIDKLAAVTFTRKAAAELKERFQLALEKAFAAETNPIKKERLAEALSGLDRCFLGTIHSFCAAILRERPIEAELDPEFQELDELEDMLLRDKVWEEYLLYVQTEELSKIDDLRKIDVSPQDLKECYINLSLYPDVQVVCQEIPPPELKLVRAELNDYLNWVQQVLPQKVPPKGWDELQKLLRKALRWRRVFDLNDDLTLLRLLAGLNKNKKVTLNRWPDADNAKQAERWFEELRINHINPVLEKWYEYRHARLVNFVLPAVKLYQGRRMEQSKLNYQDLLMLSADLLKNSPEVRRYFQQRYTHLLVDEFQDTDPIQAQIMFYLTGEDVNEKDWCRLVPKPGSLFVVGDPKQAIYRFRRADIDTYNEVKNLIAQHGGKVLYLTTNFRSVQAIGEAVNAAFKKLLPEKPDCYQAAFAPVDTVRSNGEGLCGVRTIAVPKVQRNKQEDIVKIDAAKIARWIRWAVDGNLKLTRTPEEKAAGITEQARPGDFMILLRKKKYLNVYAQALEKYGIPFQIAGGEGLANSEEMAELIKVFKAIIDPDDGVMLAAALRGRFFGFSDRQFWQFKRAGGHFNIYSAVPKGIDPRDKEAFEWAFGKLKTYRNWVLNLPGSTALEKILTDLGIIPYTLTGELGKSRSGYILQCLEFVAAAERKGTAGFSSLVDYLTLLIKSGVEEEINIAPWKGDCVRLMNLHKAKGLEAPVVFLAKPAGKTDFLPTVHIDRVGVEPCGYFVIEKKKKHGSEVLGQPVNWRHYADIEQKYLDAEEIRLLYVAATRAKNLLIISTYDGKPQLSPWYPIIEHLPEVQQLEDCPGYEYSDEPEPVSLAKDDLEKDKSSFFNVDHPVNKPTYQTTSVSSLTEAGGELPVSQSGKGALWGKIIHRVLAAYVKKPPQNAELLVSSILSEEGEDPEKAPEVLRLVDKVTKSAFWQRVLQSRQKYAELPFSVKTQPAAGKLETVVSGVIDLVFREAAGWVIADYKTDTVENEEHLKKLVKYYSPQVKMYKDFWESITKTKVAEAGLYFTSINRWVVV